MMNSRKLCTKYLNAKSACEAQREYQTGSRKLFRHYRSKRLEHVDFWIMVSIELFARQY